MEFKPWYPRDFGRTLSNTFTEEEVTQFLQKRGCSPRFVYGILMLPTILKHFIDVNPTVNIEKSMTYATLLGYKLYQLADTSTPIITPSSDPEATVEGILIFGLDEHQRNSIYELESGLMNLVNVQVEIFQKDSHEIRSVRTIDAGTFAWQGSREGLIPLKATAWSLEDFLKSSFYEHIAQSQRRRSLEMSVQSSSSLT